MTFKDPNPNQIKPMAHKPSHLKVIMLNLDDIDVPFEGFITIFCHQPRWRQNHHHSLHHPM
jgi:hypothetical protein